MPLLRLGPICGTPGGPSVANAAYRRSRPTAAHFSIWASTDLLPPSSSARFSLLTGLMPTLTPLLSSMLCVAIALAAFAAYHPSATRSIARQVYSRTRTFYALVHDSPASKNTIPHHLSQYVDEAVRSAMLTHYGPRDFALGADGGRCRGSGGPGRVVGARAGLGGGRRRHAVRRGGDPADPGHVAGPAIRPVGRALPTSSMPRHRSRTPS